MISIALDGPAGAGKSSLAKAAAAQLGFIYVDTGALYRAVGLKFSDLGFGEKLDCDIDAVLSDTVIDIKFVNGEQRVILDGKDVSDLIRTPAASKTASLVSAQPSVREFLLEMQRRLARENNCLMDGRDIGTVVLPDATLKLFVTASAEERAERRYKELVEKGEKVSYGEVLDDINRRDYKDSHREIAPLKPADDAIIFDTTGCDLNTSLERLLKVIKERIDID